MKEELTAIVGEKYVSDDIIDLYVYGSDASIHQKNPEIVVRPGTVEEVSKILKFANEKKIPVVARGAGSGMSGNAVPMSGGIILDLKRMDKILEIKPEDLYVRVEAGVVNDELNRVLKPYGFFFAPNPASGKICTIGGMVANNASGMRAVKYGATRDAVMGLKIVLATGEILDAGTRTLIESSGYQIERLMVGSEGTLGIIVEATLRLTPLPKEKSMGVAAFNTLSGAGEAISKIMSAGIIPSFLEYMDNVAIKSVNKMLNLNLPDVEAIVVFECDGIREEIDYNIERIKKVCTEQGATGIKVSSDPKEMNEIYLGRSKLFPAMSQYQDGLVVTSLADDMAVPNSKIAEVSEKIHEIAKRNEVVITTYGHAGEGLIHTKLLIDPTKKVNWEHAKKAVEEIYETVISVGGTVSGEHGVAISKAPYFKKERAGLLNIFHAIKKTLDPNNILNPGKLQDAPDDFLTATEIRYPVEE